MRLTIMFIFGLCGKSQFLLFKLFRTFLFILPRKLAMFNKSEKWSNKGGDRTDYRAGNRFDLER